MVCQVTAMGAFTGNFWCSSQAVHILTANSNSLSIPGHHTYLVPTSSYTHYPPLHVVTLPLRLSHVSPFRQHHIYPYLVDGISAKVVHEIVHQIASPQPIFFKLHRRV